MKSPIASTAIMALLALVSSAAAAYFYPWPKIADTADLVNQPLFEEYDYNQVRSIEIVQYNRDTNSLESIQLRRSGEKWILPAKDNFVATNATAISNTVNSLNNRTVLELMSDQQQDHYEYGVVDPAEYQSVANLAGLGIRITLSDRNKQEIASLVVGKGRKNDPQRTRFVRKKGQPQVYAVEFDASALITDFRQWVSPNLMNLSTRDNPAGQRVGRIMLDHYEIDQANIATAKKNVVNELDVAFSDKVEIRKFTMRDPAKPGELKEAQPLSEDIGKIITYAPTILFGDVVKKDNELAKALRLRKKDTPDSVFSSLYKYGFRKVGFQDDDYIIESVRGEMAVVTNDGVEIRMLIGATTGNLNADSGKPERYMMLTAKVNQEFFPIPTKPENVDEDSDENKAYLRAMEARESALKLADDVAKAMNRGYSNWYYVIDETIADFVIPVIREAPQPKKPAGNGP